MAEEEYQIPIFFINGQLDSGKTRFITETIEMGQFAEAKNKLLIVCEEGEEEYDEKMLKDNGVSMVVLEKEDLTEEKLKELDKQYDPWIVIVEYNGMWDPALLMGTAKPFGWQIYQSITLVNAETFGVQWANMKSIMAEMVKNVDMVIGDRLSSTYFEENKRPFHNFGNSLVRGSINRLFHTNIRDIMTGYRAFSYLFVKSFPVLSKGFEIETEMTIHAVEKNMSVENMIIEYRDRPEGSESKLNTYSDGVKVLKTIGRLYKNYRPMNFFGMMSVLLFVLSLILFVPVFFYIYRQDYFLIFKR